MNAVIVTIGDEILIGQIVDSNSAWIAENLNLVGINVQEIRSISDQQDHIVQTLADLEAKTDVVIMTGGLGPTRDDITKNALNAYFGGKLELNEEVLGHIKSLFAKRNFRISKVNEQQAVLPDNCRILKNAEGTAPGMWFERGGTIFVSVPGVPYEMRGIISGEMIPALSERMNGKVIVHQTIMTHGIPESYLAARIKHWEESLPPHVKLAYLPRPGIVRLRLTGIGDDMDMIRDLLDEETEKLRNIIPDAIFAFKDTTIENVVHDLMLKKGNSLSTAESCTGGRISGMITSIPGSSGYYKGSVIAYANEIKINELGVDAQVIEKKGAVSMEVVEQMARGIREKYRSDYGIATSGIAGPSGGNDEKPVGTTWIAVCSQEKCYSKQFFFGEHRGRNIEKTSITALNMLRKIVLDIYEDK